MAFVDYYSILGLNKTATPKEVKAQYRKLACAFHPDANPHCEEGIQKFQKINEAYTVLSDPEKRKMYDVYGEYWKIAEDLEKRKWQQENGTSVSGRRDFLRKLWGS